MSEHCSVNSLNEVVNNHAILLGKEGRIKEVRELKTV